MDNKFSSIDVDYQINKLKVQGLIITDDIKAKNILHEYGYSNLIKSYRDPYVFRNEHGELKFRDGVTFEQVCSLYTLDKSLRGAVISAMLDFEEYIKTAAANVVASAFGVHQNDYLKFSNYHDKKKKKERFQLKSLINILNANLTSSKEPIHHYADRYGIIPPWILFKSVYFSTIVNLIDQFKPREQIKLVHQVYPSNMHLNENALRKLMIDTMYVANEYRNLSAHGGRIYNHDSSYNVRWDEIWGKGAPITTGFAKLLLLLSLVGHRTPYKSLHKTLDEEVNRHCSMFPQDATYLGQILKMNIEHHQYVYVKGNKYHSNPYCSGLKNSIKLDLEEAKLKNLTPCKKCVR